MQIIACENDNFTAENIVWLKYSGNQDTLLCMSAAKKVMQHTSVIFTGTTKLLFLIHRISITTGPISIKFTYFMFSIYAMSHTKFEEN